MVSKNSFVCFVLHFSLFGGAMAHIHRPQKNLRRGVMKRRVLLDGGVNVQNKNTTPSLINTTTSGDDTPVANASNYTTATPSINTSNSTAVNTVDAPFVVALYYDIPPYISNGGRDGFEVAILEAALPNKSFEFVQMNFPEVNSAVVDGVASIGLGVNIPPDNVTLDVEGTVYFSNPFIVFDDVAASKTSDKLDITSVQDLADYGPVFTWEGAAVDIGGEYYTVFGEGGVGRDKYTPIANQTEQIIAFWETPDSIITIGKSIFVTGSKDLGYLSGTNDTSVTYHFEAPQPAPVNFASSDLRDEFDDGLKTICENGIYEELASRYEMQFSVGLVCEVAVVAAPRAIYP